MEERDHFRWAGEEGGRYMIIISSFLAYHIVIRPEQHERANVHSHT